MEMLNTDRLEIAKLFFLLNPLLLHALQMNSNVTQLPEMDYFVQKNTVVDAAILSPRSRDMCQGLPVYWMTRSMKSAGMHYFRL